MSPKHLTVISEISVFLERLVLDPAFGRQVPFREHDGICTLGLTTRAIAEAPRLFGGVATQATGVWVIVLSYGSDTRLVAGPLVDDSGALIVPVSALF